LGEVTTDTNVTTITWTHNILTSHNPNP
jgi:hypothetical protein